MSVRAWLLIGAVVASIGTAAAQQTPSFSFGAAGDFEFEDRFKATAAAVKAQNPDFLIALGDLSYGGDEREWCAYWRQEVQYNPVLLIAGNHDSGEHSGGDINKYVEFCRPCPLTAICAGDYGKQYYFDYPADAPLARFILVVPGVKGPFLGSQYKSDYYHRGKPGYQFTADAIDEARANGIEWIFVAMHKNYISMLEKNNEVSKDPGNTFMTMLLDKKVDVILQGHEHGYERSKQLTTLPPSCPALVPNQFNPACVTDSDDMLVKGAGTVIHVLGTGGKKLRTLDKNDPEREYFVRADNTTYGFGKFTVSRDAVSFTFQPLVGTMTDSFTIVKEPQPPAGGPN